MALAVRLVKQAFTRHPVVSNAVVYGSLYVGAELSQQVLTRKVLVEKGEEKNIDKAILGRYFAVAAGINSNIFYVWYKWLDGRFPGTASRTIVKKLILDQFLMTPPVIAIFFTSMSLMEGKDDVLAECKTKFVPTFLSSCAFWLPAQTLNFIFVPPAARVVYLGACSFAWGNILCYIKRLSPATTTTTQSSTSPQQLHC